MSIEIVQILKRYSSAGGLLNPGEIVGVDSGLAASLIAYIAVEYDAGDGAGTPLASPFRGQIASETRCSVHRRRRSSGNENPSAAI